MDTIGNIGIDCTIERLGSITLEEMDSIKLMNRVDTKFVTNEQALERILTKAAAAGYRALISTGRRQSDYDTLYFDTAERDMYMQHHNGRLVRQKVRTRKYLNSGETFLEIKDKNNHGRTRKKRISIPGDCFFNFLDNDGTMDFLVERCRFAAAELSPALRTRFTRITLVNSSLTERITIDRQLTFENPRTRGRFTLDNGVIIELKRDSTQTSSQMLGILLDERIHPLRVSKYCIGSALTDPELKQNRFKLKLIQMKKNITEK